MFYQAKHKNGVTLSCENARTGEPISFSFMYRFVNCLFFLEKYALKSMITLIKFANHVICKKHNCYD